MMTSNSLCEYLVLPDSYHTRQQQTLTLQITHGDIVPHSCIPTKGSLGVSLAPPIIDGSNRTIIMMDRPEDFGTLYARI